MSGYYCPTHQRADDCHRPTPRHADVRDRPSAARQVLSWVWALSPAWSLGFATAPLMIIAIKRIRHWLHILLSVVYVAMVVLMLTFAGFPDGTTRDAIFSWALAVNMFVGTGHALFIRTNFFYPQPAAPKPAAIARQQAVLEGNRQREQMRTVAREVAQNEPNQAIELRIGRVDLQPREFPDGGLIDVNNVEPRVLFQDVPVLAPYAETLATAQHLGFSSMEEMSVTLGLPPQLLDPYADRLIFLPRYEGPPPTAG